MKYLLKFTLYLNLEMWLNWIGINFALWYYKLASLLIIFSIIKLIISVNWQNYDIPKYYNKLRDGQTRQVEKGIFTVYHLKTELHIWFRQYFMSDQRLFWDTICLALFSFSFVYCFSRCFATFHSHNYFHYLVLTYKYTWQKSSFHDRNHKASH